MKIDSLNKLPEKPGVYLFKDTKNKFIYIGKAKNLKKRVKSYFSKNHPDPKTEILVTNISSLDYIVTSNEMEALILEANLIKKHKPKFNIDLKDNKTYPFIKVTLNEDYPRIIKTRRFINDGGKYFGPYTNVSVIYRSLEIIQRVFKVRTCKKKIIKGKNTSPCLNYHIGRCSGACIGAVSKQEYMRAVNDIMILLSGKFDKLTNLLTQKMEQASKNLQYEKAAFFRDQLEFVKDLNSKQKVYTPDKKDRDAIGVYEALNKYYFVILFFREGKLLGKRAYQTEIKDSISKSFSDFISQYYEENEIPDEILLSHEFDDFLLISQMLNSKKSTKILFPKKGIKKQILNMSVNNARYEFLKDKKFTEKESVLLELKNVLGMEKLPRKIECFDISNTDGIMAVGAMSSFYNGRADKKNYRKFRIKTVKGPNDVAMIKEIVSRRYTRLLNEDRILPDLIVIDGGLGQVNGAYEILNMLDLKDIPLIGLAKKEEEIIFPKNHKKTLNLSADSEGLKLLQKARDEAHRFGVTYHKKLRSKKMKFSILDEIHGVGEKKKNKLMKYFKSIENLCRADIDEILKAGLDKSSAKAVYLFFNSANNRNV